VETASDRNPQAAQMAHDSMRRTLQAQTEAIWPQERELIARYRTGAHPPPRAARVLDAGCGTGEFSARLCAEYADWQVDGVDLMPELLHWAREHERAHAPRLRVSQGDLFALPQAAATYDLVCCRHVLQAIPHAERALAELSRVLRPGGRMHLVAEDYAMLHALAEPLDVDEFWQQGPVQYTARTGTDARIGRRAAPLLAALGFEDVSVDYVIVDTQRVPRETFARIITAWRDGYTDVLADGSGKPPSWFRARFDQFIASIRDPRQYAVWFVPVVSGRKAG
jgi:ubiquinone/menaquinone biosynthesis C-methylase UbiE